MNQRRGFLDQPTSVTGSFPSIQTLNEDNCVSLDNFRLYVKHVPTYNDFSQYFDSELESAIQKIHQGMPRNLQIWLTPNEQYVINQIIKVIPSQPQEYFGKKTPISEQKPKTVCPVLLAYLQRYANIRIYGGKIKRRTTKQKRRKYSHKSKKTTRSRYHKRK
jgi:hypothetical protein